MLNKSLNHRPRDWYCIFLLNHVISTMYRTRLKAAIVNCCTFSQQNFLFSFKVNRATIILLFGPFCGFSSVLNFDISHKLARIIKWLVQITSITVKKKRLKLIKSWVSWSDLPRGPSHRIRRTACTGFKERRKGGQDNGRRAREEAGAYVQRMVLGDGRDVDGI